MSLVPVKAKENNYHNIIYAPLQDKKKARPTALE